ncbi:tetratricopeptide repeat protein [Parabacteroides sp.]
MGKDDRRLWVHIYLSLTEKAASLDYIEAQYMAGIVYGFGLLEIDLQADFAKAIMWYEKAAEKDHIEAKGKLGLIYLKALNISKSKETSFLTWIRRSIILQKL